MAWSLGVMKGLKVVKDIKVWISFKNKMAGQCRSAHLVPNVCELDSGRRDPHAVLFLVNLSFSF